MDRPVTPAASQIGEPGVQAQPRSPRASLERIVSLLMWAQCGASPIMLIAAPISVLVVE
jgi:hypothetical protein